MGVSVAEYLGQRTDIAEPVITPVPDSPATNCPFMNDRCVKLIDRDGNDRYKPTCSVRKRDGSLWIVCRHRLCATKRDISLTTYQKNILMNVAQTIFTPSIDAEDVLVRREVPIPIPNGRSYHADYIMINNGDHDTSGPSKVILEMQGGGETSQTGKISRHIQEWESNDEQSNEFLSQEVVGTGLVVTNAWRRQQEQFIVKGRSAMLTGRGNGMVFCVGSLLYDEVISKVSNAGLSDLRNHNWTLALIGFSEDTSLPPTNGPIPLAIDNNRVFFTDYQAFVRAITDQAIPCPESFQGVFDRLSGGQETIS